MVRLTVLGSCGAWPSGGRACSGYVLESSGMNLVLDLGFGTLPRLLSRLRAEEVGAVFITHSHADHCVDLFGLLRARALPKPPLAPVPVYSPSDLLDRLAGLAGPDGARTLRSGMEFHPLAPDSEVAVGPYRIRSFALPHFVPNLGFRVEVEGRVIAYTGDTGPNSRVVDLARDADLFLCEAMLQGTSTSEPEPMLLAAAEAGRYAREAHARRLMLTHFWPYDDRSVSLREASREFSREIVLAEEGLEVSVP